MELQDYWLQPDLRVDGAKLYAAPIPAIDNKMVTYAHAKSPKGMRFRQFKHDSIPDWAVDIRPDAIERRHKRGRRGHSA